MALKEYEVSLKNAPNRLRGFYGAAKAAAAAGDATKASGTAASSSSSRRGRRGSPEVLEMRPFAQLAQR